MSARARLIALVAILAGSALVRLYHLAAPMTDTLQAKQIYVANRARSIAQAPLNPMRNSLDFLDERGGRMELTEEFPLYHGLLGVGYRLFGERDWVGHALSLLGTLVAIAAFFDLARRETDDRTALLATVLLSACPLFVFYGRAVLPEPWMLAAMLASAACYRRYLDDGGGGWLAAAALAALGSALFKYFGLMIFVPLAEMSARKAGSWRRGVLSRSFLILSTVAIAPIFAWVALVFFQSPNPVSSGWVDGKVYPYFILQAPGVLAEKPFWSGLFGRFLVRDCGPVTAFLMVLGLIATLARARSNAALARPDSGMLRSWTAMGLTFYVLLGPKLRDHDYYELMMLPAAALWATRGLMVLAKIGASRVPRVVPDQCSGSAAITGGVPPVAPGGRLFARPVMIILFLAVIVQSPWIAGGLFRQDEGKLALAGRLEALCPTSGRVVAIGPGIELPTVIHYSHREGWPVHSPTLPEDWRLRLSRYRSAGAQLLAVYFEPKATPFQRASYAPLLRELPLVEKGIGPRTRAGGPSEFFILSLKDQMTRR